MENIEYVVATSVIVGYIAYAFGYEAGWRKANQNQGYALWQFFETLPMIERLDLKQKIREYNKRLQNGQGVDYTKGEQ